MGNSSGASAKKEHPLWSASSACEYDKATKNDSFIQELYAVALCGS